MRESFIRQETLPPGLYVVATPIGNLRDVTLRALDVLASADCVYAEDTRQTRRLLDAYGIRTVLKTYHDHNGAAMRPQIESEIEAGRSVALVSDAGTPLISDPGFKLVRDLRETGLQVTPIPGASALTAALSAAGLPTDTILFAGFLPPKSKARKSRLSELSGTDLTLVVYETGNRLKDTLRDVDAVFGDPQIVMARELTKLFETFWSGKASGLIEALETDGPPKGEIVLLVSVETQTEAASQDEIDAFLKARLAADGAKGAANAAAAQFGLPKRDLYARAVTLKSDTDG